MEKCKAFNKVTHPKLLNMFIAIALPGTMNPPISSEMTFRPMLIPETDSITPRGTIKLREIPDAKTRS